MADSAYAMKDETGDSYYKQIDGVKYDKGLLEKANSLTTGRGDGRISKDDADKLWEDAQDGKGVTECESRTLRYIMDNYNCTDAGKEVLKAKMGGGDAAASKENEEENKADSAEATGEEAEAEAEEGEPAEGESEEAHEEEEEEEKEAKEPKRKSRGDDDDEEEEVEQEADDDEAAREVETQDMREAKLAMQEAAQWLANEDRRARKKSRRYADYA